VRYMKDVTEVGTGEVDTGAVVFGIVLWLILFGLGGLILWQNLSH
jgi:hypothetical protein